MEKKKANTSIAKQLVTTHMFIDECVNNAWRFGYSEHEIPVSRMRVIKKVIRKLLNNMNDSPYHDTLDKYGNTYYSRIRNHLERKIGDESTSVYLTSIQFQIHDMIRNVFPKYYDDSGFHRVKDIRDYKKIKEELLR